MRGPLGIVVVCALTLLRGPAAAGDPATPAALAESYLRAVMENDWRAARAAWSAAELAASERLGIVYADLPFKLDSSSLLVLEKDLCQSGDIDVSVDGITGDTSSARLRYRLRAGDESATITYHATATADGWRFVSPVAALSAGWPRKQTEYLDLRIQPSSTISDAALRRLDRFVAETCARLAVAPTRMDLLRHEKLGYYICDDATVEEIVGAPTRGVALLQTDAVVTSEPCHLHELAHLLVNFALQDLPLYTLPFVQEGTAVALGGRWGRAPEVMGSLGRFTLQEGFLAVEDLFTWHGFHENSPDLTYAPSGVLIDFLLDRLGGERFLALYRRLSGALDDLRLLERRVVRERILTAAGCDWRQLQSDFERFMEDQTCGGIRTDVASEGKVLANTHGDGLTVTVSIQGPWLEWVVESDEPPVTGALLIFGSQGAATSRLFAEQFPGRIHAGEQMAIVFSSAEVGLYDFRTDLLLAKYVSGFCPTHTIVADHGRRLAFDIRRDLFPDGDWWVTLVAESGGDAAVSD